LRNILKLCWVKWWKGHTRKTFLSYRNLVFITVSFYIFWVYEEKICVIVKFWELHLWLLVLYFHAQYHITPMSCIGSNCVPLTIPYWFNCISLSKQCFQSLFLLKLKFLNQEETVMSLIVLYLHYNTFLWSLIMMT
jgi:hypothetical protein